MLFAKGTEKLGFLYGFSYLVNPREEQYFLAKTASQCLLQYYDGYIYQNPLTGTPSVTVAFKGDGACLQSILHLDLSGYFPRI